MMEKMKLSEAMELGFLMTYPTEKGYGPGRQEHKTACAMQAALLGIGEDAYHAYHRPVTDAITAWPELQPLLQQCPHCDDSYVFWDGVVVLAVHINDNHGGRQVALEYVKEAEALMAPPEIPEEHVPQEQEGAVESDSEVFSPEREEELVPA